MRIAIIGSFSTGKSTLAADLSGLQLLHGYEIDIGAERRVANKMGHIIGKSGEKQVVEFQSAILSLECYKQLVYKDYMTDCPAMLAAVYSRLTGAQEPIIEALAFKLSRRYDLVLYCPLSGENVADGCRHMDNDLRERAAIEIKKYLVAAEIEHIILPPLHSSDRTVIAAKIIQKRQESLRKLLH